MDTYFDEETARVWNEMNKLNNEKNHQACIRTRWLIKIHFITGGKIERRAKEAILN